MQPPLAQERVDYKGCTSVQCRYNAGLPLFGIHGFSAVKAYLYLGQFWRRLGYRYTGQSIWFF